MQPDTQAVMRDELRKLVESWRIPDNYDGISDPQLKLLSKAMDAARRACATEVESLLSAPEAAPRPQHQRK